MSTFRIRPINTGNVMTSPRQYHFHHSAHKYLGELPSEDVPLPVFAFLLENEEHKILVDTGMSDTERANTFHHPGSWQEEGQAIHEQLARIGISCEDIDTVIFTHLHWDHCSNMEHFSNAKFYVHKKEMEFAKNPIPVYYKSYEHPFLGLNAPFCGVDFVVCEGCVEIYPGIRIFESFGHSPGHISVAVDTKNGTYFIAGDIAFRMENFLPIPALGYEVIPPSRYVNIVDSYNSILAHKTMAESLEHILLTHDSGILKKIEKNPFLA